MSIREDIASNIHSVINAISSPDIKLCTRQPFELEELSQQQYPAVVVQTSEETREDAELGSGAKTRSGTIDFVILGFVKGTDTNIDTARNALITAIETALESDSNSLSSSSSQSWLSSDEGTLFPVGGIRMVVRCIYQFNAGTP